MKMGQYRKCFLVSCENKPASKRNKFCSRKCVNIYYRFNKERNKKISDGLKKYFSSLTKEERGKLYNTAHKGAIHANSKPIGSSYIQKHNGYKMIKTGEKRWEPEHKVIVENMIDRNLKKGETIHHIDSNRLNNDPKNLYLFEKRGLHTSFTVLVKHEIINPFILKSNLKKEGI